MPTLDPLRAGQTMQTTKTQQANKAHSVQTEQAASTHKTPVEQSDFSMSAQGKVVSDTAQRLAKEPHFNSARVAELQAQIADGTYKVDADKLANNMIDFEQDIKK